ncbi:hypothetical protein [Yersinia phage fPS-19]|uniref:Uncharacterized protein n=15 Tax=Helsettvirus TaxID=2732684 RepID=A0A2D0PEJ5_9CAUD|nr:HNH endonuclease [Yersinia phage fPS-9]YP_009799176.1 HNH endonuclease [Yersinia phage fPS-53]YP_009799224.1 HNH endonuclease [Yersinia phage fPS-54-ocr]SOO46379.1 hypothetical protein [Yersinia phage fPS-52]SOO46430.1 hypothetical protein [Yersinia phage fPS-19]SOO46481.1 hypothetical protein [Yersinia phage fPS-26]SOO46532.1 hypothetical protein [Yersinia phage fPS-7]SOO46633.1 hypothetical protein [Yersinia phage fPS-89]SOO46684.1 hypothetical protein [Yersinia phage fPS-86]SOO46734.
MATRYEVNTIHSSPKGDFKVLEYIAGSRTPSGTKIHPRVVIRMLHTGSVLNVQSTNIPKGKFKDLREPSVCGIGYIGSDIKITGRGTYVRRVYDLWANMLKRVVHEYTGITVDKRWLNFTNFLNTIVDVKGYSAWEQGDNVHLDKDLSGLCRYSVEDCVFIPAGDNISEASLRRWRKK